MKLTVYQNDLKDEIIVLQSSLDEEGEQAKEEISAGQREIENLESQVGLLTQECDTRKRELRVFQENQPHNEACERERDMLRKQLEIYRGTEAQNEVVHKERDILEKELKDVRAQVEVQEKERNSLRRELNEIQFQAEKYEKEMTGMNRQLEQSQDQHELDEREGSLLRRELQRRQTELEASEKETNVLKRELINHRQEQDSRVRSGAATEQVVAELRKEVSRLERTLQSQRRDEDLKMAQERKDLRQQIKASKIEIDGLRRQVSTNNERLESHVLEKKEVRARLRKIDEEREYQKQKTSRANSELDQLRRKCDNLVIKAVELEKRSGEQKQAAQQVTQDRDKQYHGEIKGLSKQIMYLRARCAREGRFRADLAYVKKYFLMQLEMYNAWWVVHPFHIDLSRIILKQRPLITNFCSNHAGLQMLEEMGIVPDRSVREKRPSLKSVAYAIIAGVRMKRLKEEWASNVKTKEKLSATAAQTRSRAR